MLARRDPTDLAWILAYAGYGFALLYAAIILSFLGGIWWTFAMRRTDGQARLASVAVVPPLVGFGLVAAAVFGAPMTIPAWPAIVLGCVVMLTLLIDKRLVRTGEAPTGWMALRIVLSVGLGLETIAAGVLLAI